MSTTAWATEMPFEERFRPSLVERARKREVIGETGPVWIVRGDPSLGDSYPNYTVREVDEHTHRCSCQKHPGGQYRSMCSHLLAVLLKRAEMPPERPNALRQGEETNGRLTDEPGVRDVGAEPLVAPALAPSVPTR